MLLSIIIPHYNLQKELLERCIESIIGQGLPNDCYEIIVVDDASDNAPMWVESHYPGINISCIVTGHGGPGAARNKGMEVAKGKYIQFVDADDMLMPESNISQCLDTIQKERPQILRFNYQVRKSPDEPFLKEKKNPKFSNTISGAAYMRDKNLSGSPCTYFFLRELAIRKNIRFPENTFHEDEEFNTILHYHAQSLIYSNAVLYCYCTRQGSTTTNSSPEFEKRRIDDLLDAITRLKKFGDLNKESMNSTQKRGFEHKFTMLTVDAIINMMRTGMKTKSILEKCNERLAPIGAYPLPRASYSVKYRIFRLFANCKTGMYLLRMFTPGKRRTKK